MHSPGRGIIARVSAQVAATAAGIMSDEWRLRRTRRRRAARGSARRRRRWLRTAADRRRASSSLAGRLSAVGVAALWAFTILPRSLPSVTALETFQPLQGTKVYDDNDELHHRAPRRAAHLRAARAHSADAARRGHRHRGPALLLPLGHRSDRHRARDLSELPARAHRRGRQHDHPAADQGPLPHARTRASSAR